MRLLAIESCTEGCSAALAVDGEVIERFELLPRGHAEHLLKMIDALLAEAQLLPSQLDQLAWGRGPGSFTGVRIGTALMQGLAFAIDRPLIPISSLAALAHGAWRQQQAPALLAAIDARMGELYWGAYRIESTGQATLMGVEQVAAARALQLPSIAPGVRWVGVGSGWGVAAEPLQQRLGSALQHAFADRYPRAYDVALLALASDATAALPAAQARPVYLRDQVVAPAVSVTL